MFAALRDQELKPLLVGNWLETCIMTFLVVEAEKDYFDLFNALLLGNPAKSLIVIVQWVVQISINLVFNTRDKGRGDDNDVNALVRIGSLLAPHLNLP